MLNGLDLFTGIGGLSRALSPWVRPKAYCENDRFAQGVILSRISDLQIPDAPIWDDVRTLKGTDLSFPVDILYGGFPCQDISVAGNGAGLEGKRSGLVVEVFRLIDEIRPRFVFLENVPGIRKRGGQRIGGELASRGYDQRWLLVSAAEIGAPHLRKRWFLLAHANREGLQESGHHEIQAREMDKTLANGDPRFCDASEASLFSRGISSKLRLQESLWSENAANLGRVHDGLSPVVHRIRALGNAVVPLQARTAFERLMGLS